LENQSIKLFDFFEDFLSEEYMPKRYFTGLSDSTISKRKQWFREKKKKYETGDTDVFREVGPGQSKKPKQRSPHTVAIEKKMMNESADVSLRAKAEKFNVPFGILKKVYKRGVGAWTSGHRPGVGPEQWGHARVNSFLNKGKTYSTADADLAKKLKEYRAKKKK
jgi:hypothetical protein